jgi:hypothetical protein
MDTSILVGLIAAGAIGALYVNARRAITIVELEIANGAVTVVRGGVAPPILADLRDVAKPIMRKLHVRVVRAQGRAEVQLRGEVSPAHAQQIRNVIGSVPLARLMNVRSRR